MEYIDPETNERYIPYVIEPAVGVERTILTVLCDAYHEETLDDGTTREVMKFHPFLAPYKACILPLVKKYHSEKAMEIYKNYLNHLLLLMMNLVVLVKDIEERMHLVLHIVLL